MKFLINDSTNTDPNLTTVKGDFGDSIVILTDDDIIKDDHKQIRKLRGFKIDTILIPKIFKYSYGKEILENTNIFKTILPSLSSKGRFIYY